VWLQCHSYPYLTLCVVYDVGMEVYHIACNLVQVRFEGWRFILHDQVVGDNPIDFGTVL
jgi:hypothetical protein